MPGRRRLPSFRHENRFAAEGGDTDGRVLVGGEDADRKNRLRSSECGQVLCGIAAASCPIPLRPLFDEPLSEKRDELSVPSKARDSQHGEFPSGPKLEVFSTRVMGTSQAADDRF